MIKRVLRLDCLATFASGNLQVLAELNDPIAAAWRTIKEPGLPALVTELAKKGIKKNVIYERRKAWVDKFQIDIALPYQLYCDEVYYGSHSSAKPENRAALNMAVGQEDAAEAIRLLAEEAKNFDFKRVNVVGTTLKSRPVMLSAKVAGGMTPKVGQGDAARVKAGRAAIPRPTKRSLAPPGRRLGRGLGSLGPRQRRLSLRPAELLMPSPRPPTSRPAHSPSPLGLGASRSPANRVWGARAQRRTNDGGRQPTVALLAACARCPDASPRMRNCGEASP
jgi:hypothetical protein